MLKISAGQLHIAADKAGLIALPASYAHFLAQLPSKPQALPALAYLWRGWRS